jgi:aspartate aminotransferase/aminotransferase
MNEMPLSRSVQEIPDATSIAINQLVYDLKRVGHDPTVLSLGEAFFDIPLFDFEATDIEKGYHYSDSQGLPELREKIANFYNLQYRTSVAADEVLVTAGSKAAIFMSLLTAVNPGEQIALHEPCWLSYPHQARLAGIGSIFIPYSCDVTEFYGFFTPTTRLLILNNPNNPAGRIYSRDELDYLCTECRKHDIYILVDEAYSDFVHEEPFHSIAEVRPDKKGIIVVNSLSKNMGMSGWRIGYTIAEPRFIRALLKVNQHLITCAPTILMRYVTTYFDRLLNATLPQAKAVAEKRQRVAGMLKGLGLQHLPGDATFYFFVNIGNFPGTSTDFAMRLLLHNLIAVVPGSAYGRSTDRFIRVGIGTESEERIWDALQVIKSMTIANTLPEFDVKMTLDKLVGRGAELDRGERHDQRLEVRATAKAHDNPFLRVPIALTTTQ